MKQHLKYSEWQAAQPKKLTVAQVITRFIDEMGEQKTGRPGVKPLGESHVTSLRRICREPFGRLVAAEVTKGHVIEFARFLRQTVQAPTANQYLVYPIGYTGHETTQVYERNYLSLNVEKLKHAMRDSSGIH